MTGPTLTWEEIIENGDDSHSTVTIDSSSNTITVSGEVEGEWGSSDTSINGLDITGDNAVLLEGTGTLTVTGTVTLNSDTTISGMTMNANSSVSGGTVTLKNGATLIAQSVSASIVFGETSATVTNTIQLDSSSATLSSISNLSPGDVIEFVGNTWDTSIFWVANGDGTYALKGSTGDTLIASVTFAKKADGTSYTPSDFTAGETTVSYNGGTSTALTLTCFLPGTRIRTPEGDTAVENLRIGSEITVYREGQAVGCPVKWVGRNYVTVHPELPDDESGYPVRIVRDAVAQGVPDRDLLVTAEHCLFFEGGFVPARMLVNGRSIYYDRTITSYTYYHIETEQHSIIMADGLLTESYLDTGNRQSFEQPGSVVRIGGKGQVKTWARDAAAPLTVGREVVEPLFRRLEERAEQMGLKVRTQAPVLTGDADLHLLTDTGEILRAIRTANDRIMFMVPPHVSGVYLVSRASRPSDAVGPFVDDRRRMGVLVGEITFFDAGQTSALQEHLTGVSVKGWHGREQGMSCRWTDGRAFVDLGERRPDSFGMLAVQVLAAGPYVLTEGVQDATRSLA
ncbi:hypothetical protein GMO_21120 [Gluconobacter morbifer G707]|uniref:Hedgehog/Intein (Hint) domain-containing protein n=1 Tax=Gluconobacter morbifer G707 TaxID=1088869 RepID=G6XKU6_9PROT|nr:hypothetical protein GMO_21120 [Gluconobacter morbifer G707]